MKTIREHYQEICHASDALQVIRAMRDHALHQLIDDLHTSGITTGVPGLVLGMATVEASDRWNKEQQDKPGAVGEGSI